MTFELYFTYKERAHWFCEKEIERKLTKFVDQHGQYVFDESMISIFLMFSFITKVKKL